MNQFKIKNIKFDNPLVLAPMEAVNCTAFRILCRKFGAGLVYTHMIDTDVFMERLKENNDDEKSTIAQLINPREEESPVAIQIVGADDKKLAFVTEMLNKYADIIDYNASCPKGDILGKKAGSYLVKHPNMLEKHIKTVLDNAKVPVTCKIRSGWDETCINAVENAKLLEDAGVDAICLHARTRKQLYTGKADWNLLAKVKAAIDIPLIGNGDIASPKGAKLFFDITKCDAGMIGRAAKGYPWIFKMTNDFLTKETYDLPTLKEKKDTYFEFVEMYGKYETRHRVSELKHHALWFFSGHKKSDILKHKIMACEDLKALMETVKSF